MDQSEQFYSPSPPPQTEETGEDSWREDHDPKPNAKPGDNARETQGNVRQHFDAGEFDKTMAELEALTADQLARFTDAKSPIIDAKENRFFLCGLKRDVLG